DELRSAAARCDECRASWRRLGALLAWPQVYWEEQPLAELAARVAALAGAPNGWREWTEFNGLRGRAVSGLAGPALLEAEEGSVAWQNLARAFERRFLARWLDARAEASEALRRFRADAHEARVSEFRELDRAILAHHRRALAARLRARAQERLQDPALA